RSSKNVGAVVCSSSRFRSEPSNNIRKCCHRDRSKTHALATACTSSFVVTIPLKGAVMASAVVIAELASKYLVSSTEVRDRFQSASLGGNNSASRIKRL